MIVKRGEEWGRPATVPVDAVVVRSDRELADAVTAGGLRPLLLRGGDLHRSLGSPTAADATVRVPIDLITVTTAGGTSTAVAHAVVRRRGWLGWWRGRIVAVMNADHVGAWDAAPRAHPNDGWLDIVEVSETMSLRARWQAWRRMRAGTHVPHPDITLRRVRAESFTFGDSHGLWVDGVDRGTVRSLRVDVDPDGAEVYV